jgi:hypothetical protein
MAVYNQSKHEGGWKYFRGTYCSIFYPEDWSSRYLQNVGNYLPFMSAASSN